MQNRKITFYFNKIVKIFVLTPSLNNRQQYVILCFRQFSTATDSIFDMMVLIVSDRYTLVSYSLSLTYNVVLTIVHIFSTWFTSGLDYSILFSPVNHITFKKFTVNLRYMRISIIVHKCTLSFETEAGTCTLQRKFYSWDRNS